MSINNSLFLYSGNITYYNYLKDIYENIHKLIIVTDSNKSLYIFKISTENFELVSRTKISYIEKVYNMIKDVGFNIEDKNIYIDKVSGLFSFYDNKKNTDYTLILSVIVKNINKKFIFKLDYKENSLDPKYIKLIKISDSNKYEFVDIYIKRIELYTDKGKEVIKNVLYVYIDKYLGSIEQAKLLGMPLIIDQEEKEKYKDIVEINEFPIIKDWYPSQVLTYFPKEIKDYNISLSSLTIFSKFK